MIYRDFWEAGYRVFGLHGAKDGACDCGWEKCDAPFKHPLTESWQHTPEWSEDQIDLMEETGQFNTGYGVLVSGLLVVDVDQRNGGVDSLAVLVDKIPEIMGAGLVVETGSGNGSKHFYFSCPIESFVQSLDEYPGIDFKTSGFVVGPGSTHLSGKRYQVLAGSPYDIWPAPQALLDLIKRPEYHRAEHDGSFIDLTDQDINEMLSYIEPDCAYDQWIRCGMAIHDATRGMGEGLFDSWSRRGSKYPGADRIARHWHSFGKANNPVTIGTLIHYAEAGGYQQAIEDLPTIRPPVKEASNPQDQKIDTKGVDLLRPPGFVGEIAAFINSQCLYKRENLAVGAALTAVGNLIGLRYADDYSNATSNLFTFCVAESSTGKEAVLQALTTIHKAAGIHRATHSSIKSEQEIIRNLVRHQAAFYAIDELGLFLQKLDNASKRGTASYLEGIIATLMSAYSKANGVMLLTGDMKEEVQNELKKQLSQATRAKEAGEARAEKDIRRIESALKMAEEGLHRPFLSVIGFTTPSTFSHCLTKEQARTGFIGRALIINELETNPRRKKGHVRPQMDPRLENAIIQLYNAGHYDADEHRIEHYGSMHTIATTKEALAMLEQIEEYFWRWAEEDKGEKGTEAVIRRGFEMVLKVSFILGAPSGLRTAEHVRWAFALVESDIRKKTDFIDSHERESSDPSGALVSRIKAQLSEEHGETEAVIYQRVKSKSVTRSVVNATLARLEKTGCLRCAGKKYYLSIE